jgi:3-hydroxyacyl-CoA dehydrogenase / 3-hydroxy-2-methylbutyryl-CoA dehydrogenase
MLLSNATAVITGGASGLGEATARHLLREGANVVLVDCNAERGQALAKELGVRAAFVQADVTISDHLQSAMDTAVAKFGGLQILVNCAGIVLGGRTLSKSGPHDIDKFKKVIAVNLIGTFDAARLAAAKMAQNEPNQWGERGVMVTTASIAAFEGQIGQAAYAASKAGVAGLTLVMSRDLASYGIRVCTIAPGIFDTPMVAGLSEDIRASLGKQVPFPSRLGRPEEYAMLAAHIIQNPMLNGETIRLDGAVRMGPK